MPLGEVEAIEAGRGGHVGGALAASAACDHRRHVAQVVGPEHEVDLGKAREQRVALLLGDAAAHADQAPRRAAPSSAAAAPRSL